LNEIAIIISSLQHGSSLEKIAFDLQYLLLLLLLELLLFLQVLLSLNVDVYQLLLARVQFLNKSMEKIFTDNTLNLN
jgi:hypothetical protein